jgi:hypothetical protein
METINIRCTPTRFDVDDDGTQIALAHAQANAMDVVLQRGRYPARIVIHDMDATTQAYRKGAPAIVWMVIPKAPDD